MIKALDRCGSDSKKWHKYAGTDILPLWIADTDFAVDDKILAAAQARLQHAVLGYPYNEEDYIGALVEHCAAQYDWEIEAEWVVPIPGCVPGLNFCRGLSQLRGKQAAVTATPTYPPFFNQSKMMPEFRHHCVPARWENGQWSMDFAGMAEAAARPDSGLLILCHPHNPLSRVYREEELQEYAHIAQAHDLIVCSDEIHCDLILNGSRHRPFAMLSEDALKRSVTLMAPSKTYNIAGMCASYAVIADADLRADFMRVSQGFADVNVLGRVMAQAAYREGETWRQAQIAYLQRNAQEIERRIAALPPLSVAPLEATYLAFIDCRALPVENPQRYFEQYGLGFADGADYAAPGFVRFNFGCSFELVQEALNRLEAAVKAL